MEGFFSLDCQKVYLIYGTGGNGLKVFSLLKKSGCHILGFIDQRAPKLSVVKDKPVWNPDNLSQLKDKDKIVVIITIKNVFEHSKIALELAQKGFFHCVYKPLSVLENQSSEELEHVSLAHDSFINDASFPTNLILPDVELNLNLCPRNLCLICQRKDSVTTWLPVELLFNYKSADVYEDVAMAAFFPLLDLYQLFEGSRIFSFDERKRVLSQFISYCSEWAKSNDVIVQSDLVDSWINSRKKSFDQMQLIFERDFKFFIRNAPYVQLLPDLKFHLTQSGRNRVVFLIAKGYHYVPVQMLLSDYTQWYKESVSKKILDYLENSLITCVNTPISHPLLCDLEAKYPDFHRHISFPISLYIIRKLYMRAKVNDQGYLTTSKALLQQERAKVSILTLFDIDGTLSRFLYRQGYSVFRTSNVNSPYIKLLDSMYEQVIPSFSRSTSVNIVILTEMQVETFYSLSIDLSNVNCIFLIEQSRQVKLQYDCHSFDFQMSLSSFYFENKFLSLNVYSKERLSQHE